MLICVEGGDGTGKTTFVKQLVEQLDNDVDVFHRTPVKRHPLLEYEADLESYRPGEGRNIICDRWHWGERVYGPIIRSESKLDTEAWLHVEMFLQIRGAFMLWLDPPDNITLLRLDRRGEKLVPRTHVKAVLNSYRGLAPKSLLELRRIEFVQDEHPPSAVFQAAMLELDCAPLASFHSLIGSPRPDLLLLGERRGPGAERRRHRAAFVPYANTSGHYLMEALPNELYGRVAIANACEENVEDLWLALGRPAIAALGREAQAECKKAGIVCSRLPHPQWVRRFHNEKIRDYGRAILESSRRLVDVSWQH